MAYSAHGRVESIVMSMSVCLSVCPLAQLETIRPSANLQFLCLFPVVVARSSADVDASVYAMDIYSNILSHRYKKLELVDKSLRKIFS